MKAPFLDRYAPHVLAAALCGGLAAANAIRTGVWLLMASLTAVVVSAALEDDRRRLVALALALALGGLWWGGVRLDALDRSVLAPRTGEVGSSLIEITGPARRTPFRLRVPGKVREFRRRRGQ